MSHQPPASHDGPPALKKVNSTAYAIGVLRKRTKSKVKSQRLLLEDKSQPLLVEPIDNENDDNKKRNLCNLKKDLSETWNMIKGSWINLLLIFVPFGIISHAADWNATVVFFLNFFGMIPLASILGDATEALAEHLGESVGGLLNATFGNAVEIVVMILVLAKAKSVESNPDQQRDYLTVVQTSLIGSIFSNSLLVLGCAFVANGIWYPESSFNVTATSANVSLLMISAFVMILPGPYNHINTEDESPHDILMISRAAAIILLLMYSCLLVFVLVTHKNIMNPESNDHGSNDDNNNPSMQLQIEHKKNVNQQSSIIETTNENDMDEKHKEEMMKQEMNDNDDDDDDEDELELSLFGSMIVLCCSTTLVAVLSEFLVDAIEPMSEKLGMSKAFVGIILLPIIGNAVEHITAIRMAARNKMDIALSIAIGSATQVAMFVVGLGVLISWMMGIGLNLAFDPFEVNLFIYSSIIIFALVSDGSSNWLEGVMLLGLYVLIAIAVWDQEYQYTLT